MQESSLSQNAQAAQDDDEEVQERIQVCVFELSDRFFALSIFDVQEILEEAEITRVPTTPHFLHGVINLRGDIVPVVDVREVLHLPIKPPSRESRIMILTINKVLLGILVDAIKEVTHMEKRIVQSDSDQIGISDGRYISNIIQYKDGFLVLLNLDNLYQAIQL
jgi:purine-binding chemotaxis protein CheW